MLSKLREYNNSGLGEKRKRGGMTGRELRAAKRSAHIGGKYLRKLMTTRKHSLYHEGGYDAGLKKSSLVKKTMNRALADCFDKPSGLAIVIDAETLCTSRTMVKQAPAGSKILVLNYEQEVIDKAKKLSNDNVVVDGSAGITTECLHDISTKAQQEIDVCYLDYCGTPEDSMNGWSPKTDIRFFYERLRKDGIIAATFSKRTKNAKKKAENLFKNLTSSNIHPHMFCFEYCETVPMMTFVLGVSDNLSIYPIYERIENANIPGIQFTIYGEREELCPDSEEESLPDTQSQDDADVCVSDKDLLKESEDHKKIVIRARSKIESYNEESEEQKYIAIRARSKMEYANEKAAAWRDEQSKSEKSLKKLIGKLEQKLVTWYKKECPANNDLQKLKEVSEKYLIKARKIDELKSFLSKVEHEQ